MLKNISIEDRIIRFVIFDFLVGMSYWAVETYPILAGIAFLTSLIVLLTVIFGYSPVYHIFGFSTKAKIPKDEPG